MHKGRDQVNFVEVYMYVSSRGSDSPDPPLLTDARDKYQNVVHLSMYILICFIYSSIS